MLFTPGRAIPVLLAAAALCLQGAENDALAMSTNIQAKHLPYGTILDPVLAGGQVVSYTRCGDSALWTGHYLAAESFRYAVTKSGDALANVRKALDGLALLVDVTGTGLLSRCAVPMDSPYAAAVTSEEAGHGVFTGSAAGRSWFFIGNTSRDQYVGVFFGLAVAYDFAPDASVKPAAAALATRLLDKLVADDWNIVMPDGRVSTTFAIRPDQQLTLLQIGRHVNSHRYGSRYSRASAALSPSTIVPAGVDALDEHDSYFKFNLDVIDFYNLVRLQGGGWNKFWYSRAYDIVRSAIEGHGNAHFNMIDRALEGANSGRDAETRALLDAWLKRPRTDEYVDYRGQVPSCGAADQACKPLPVEQRVRTDFLWQRSPFLLVGGGKGDIETAGIDYILPYWMARYYRVIP